MRLAAIQDYQRLRPRSQLKWNVPGCELPQPDGTLRSTAELTGEERTTMQWHHDVLELAPYAPVDSSVGDFPDMRKDWSSCAPPTAQHLLRFLLAAFLVIADTAGAARAQTSARRP